MSTELTPVFTHRTNSSATLYLEEQFGHLQFVVNFGDEPKVFRLSDEDAEKLTTAMWVWVDRNIR